MTDKRKLVLDVVKKCDGHITAEEVFLSLRNKGYNLVYATVYNNLNYLADNGFLKRIKLPYHADYFDKNLYHHNHFICDKCQKIWDEEVTKPFIKFIDSYGNNIDSCETFFHGICAECSKS